MTRLLKRKNLKLRPKMDKSPMKRVYLHMARLVGKGIAILFYAIITPKSLHGTYSLIISCQKTQRDVKEHLSNKRISHSHSQLPSSRRL